MAEWVTRWMETMGYWGVLLLMFLENVFPPIPSEVIMPAAGFAAARGEMTLWGVVLAGTAGSVLGALPLYYLGKWVGPERLKRWAGKHGHWVAVSEEDIEKAVKWFDRHCGSAVLVGRLVPGVRSLISIPAGIDGMSMPRFLAYTAVGSGVWATGLAMGGVLLEENYERVAKFIDPVTYVVIGGIVVGFVVRVIRLKRRRAAAA